MQDDTQLIYGSPEPLALEQSPQVGDLMTAFAQAQAEMDNPEADSVNAFYKSRYSSLAAVRNAVVPHLARHGITTTQHACVGEGWVRCITVFWCGEQYLKSTMQCRVVKTRRDGGSGQIIPVAELNHQDYTSVFNYLRRVSLQALCNITGEEDDDGNQATGKEEKAGAREGSPQRTEPRRQHPETRPPRPAPVSTPTTIDAALAQEGALGLGNTERAALLREIEALQREAIAPLRHPGMYKAIYYHSFQVESPGYLKAQSLEILSAGMKLYRHLTAQLTTWDREVAPSVEDWIAQQKRTIPIELADEDTRADGIDPTTGEIPPDIPDDWLTQRELQERQERQEQREREEAALLERAQS